MPAATARSWSVRIISSPVRSPTWASRGCEWPPNGRWRMRPSAVRSKTAPQQLELADAVGRLLRRGAAAIRGLLRSLPPTIVSRKWTCHESDGATWARAAATPPSAITVWALPSSDLQTRPTSAPAALAAIAARSPAPPAPMTRTSCGRTWGFVGSVWPGSSVAA